MNSTRNFNKAKIFVSVLFFLVMIIFATSYSNIHFASASGPIAIEVVQNETVFYRGNNYLVGNNFANFASEGFENALYDALKVTVNGVETTIPSQDISIENLTEITQPKTYNATIKIKYNNVFYSNSLSIVISKAKLFVGVKINGETSITIDEGVPYRTEITYHGFVASDNIDTLEIPAIIVSEPKRPISGYSIVASGAKSSLYDFVYQQAKITIISKPLSMLEIKENDKEIIVLKGQYSPYCQLEFVNVGISPANSLYIQIKQNLDKFYANSGIYDSYKESEAYSINLLVDGIKEDASGDVILRLPPRSLNKDKYLIIAFYNDGVHEVISGTAKDGYLYFTAADMGNFVVFTPVEGIKTTVLIAIGIGLIGGFILVIILVSIFRRKY